MNCPHCKIELLMKDGLTGETVQMKDGDAGMCMNCLFWCQISGKTLVAYTPTVEQMITAAKAVSKVMQQRIALMNTPPVGGVS